jgi:tagaturonate reductase
MKILQFGTGVFLRGFFDWMIEDLNNKKLLNAAVTMVKLTSHGDLKQYREQDGKYHIISRGLQNGKTINQLQQINCIKEFIHPYQQWQEFLSSAEEEDYQLIISNSTEAGLCFESTANFSTCPSSFPAKLYAWLKHRFKYFSGNVSAGLQIMACELIPDNGKKLKNILLQHAAEHESTSQFSEWLENSCHFINTLVDRIVSKVPAGEIDALQEEYSINDKLMVCAEPYHFLAIDSDKLESILPLQKANINIVVTKDLSPIRERKVKVLNGAHMLLVPAGLLLGNDVVADALKDPKLRSFVQTCLYDEIAPTLSDTEINSYIASVIERFENPFLNHRLENIALNSATKIGQRLFPSIKDFYNKSGRYPEKLLTAVAIYLELCKGEITEPGTMKTSWGVLKDNADALEFLNSLNQLNGIDAAQKIVDSEFWPIADEMKGSFPEALGKAIEKLRSNGIKNSI